MSQVNTGCCEYNKECKFLKLIYCQDKKKYLISYFNFAEAFSTFGQMFNYGKSCVLIDQYFRVMNKVTRHIQLSFM